MATTIDQKVVEMRFDNSDFERNTKQTMSTLDKLKEKLHFKGAADGLEDFSRAAKKVNMNHLADGIQTVSAKFSAMEVIGTTALVNITNQAVNAAKQMAKSLLGLESMKAGFDEYSMTMNTVQTLVNSTGKSVKQVEGYLKELDDYADKTVYSTADMFNNIYKFTNAGVSLEDAKTAMIGIANATAYAGQGAQQASIAYYNLAQSMSMGYLTTIDYKSLNLANIATKDFKQNLADAAIANGTLKKASNGMYKTQKGTYTLQSLFTEGLKDQWATTKVMMDVFKKYGSQETEIGKKAWAAAQEVKTFGMAIETLKAQAGTGWKETWQHLFGGLDDAKRVWTGLTNFIGRFLSVIDDWRNRILNIAMNNPLKELFDKINANPIISSINKVDKKLKNSSHTLAEYQKMVDRIWRGDFKNQPYRKALVEAEGYNYAATQSLVNLGADRKGYYTYYRLTQKDIEKAEKKYGVIAKETTTEVKKEQQAIEELTDAQLKKMGLTDEEIKTYRDLEKGAKKYGMTIEDLAKKMSKATGRDLLYGNGKEDGDPTKITGAFEHIGALLTNIAKAIKEAWQDVFEGITGVDLYFAIEKLNKFTEALRKATDDPNSQGMKNFRDTLRGLFSILKLITTVLGGGFSIAWTIFKTVLETLGYDVLDFTGALGRVIAAFTKFITKNEFVIKGVVFLTKVISNAIIAMHKFVTSFISLNKIVETVGKVIDKVKNWFASVGKEGLREFILDLKKFFDGLKTADNIPQYIFTSLIKGFQKWGGKLWSVITSIFGGITDRISNKFGIDKGNGFFSFGINCVKGLIEGLKSGSGNAIKAFAEWASNILKSFAEKLGIHSPSTEFFGFGKNIIQGLYNGISTTIGLVYNLVVTIGTKLIDIVKNLDMGSIIAALIAGGTVFAIIKVAQALSILANGLASVNGVIAESQKVMKAFRGVLNAFKVKIITSALKDVAISVAILVGSIWVLTKLDTGKVWASIGAIAALIALLGVLVVVAGKFGEKEALDFAKLALTILALGLAIGMIAKAFKRIAEIKEVSWEAMIAFGLIIASLVGVAVIAGRAKKQITSLAGVLLAIGVALVLMSRVVKTLGRMKKEELIQGGLALAYFEALIIGLMAATKLLTGSTNVSKIGGALMAIGVTFVLMSRVVKTLGRMKKEELHQGTKALAYFEAMIISLMAATRLLTGSKNVKAIGGTLAAVGAAILMMGITVKLLGKMDPKALIKGSAVVGAFMLMIYGLIKGIAEVGGKEIKGIAATLGAVSACIVAMTLAVAILGMMEPKNLAKGLVAVGLLSLFIIGLIKATKKAKNLAPLIYSLTAALAVLALSIGLLSIIDPKRLIAPTLALSSLMLCFSLMIKLSKNISAEKKTLIGLGVMVGVVAILAVIVWRLSKLNPGSVLQVTVALSALLLALVASLFIISKIASMSMKNLMVGLGGLALLVAMLFPLIKEIQLLSSVKNAVPSIKALILFMGALTLMLIGIAATGAIYAATGGLGLLGLVGLYAMIPFILSIIGALALMNAIPNAEANTLLLTSLLSAMVGMLVPLSLLGPLAAIGVTALYALVALMPPLLLFAGALGALFTYVPMLQEFLNTGMQVLINLASGLGEMIGAFVGGAMTKISESLPQLGLNLSQFMINATPFIIGCKLVTGQTLKAVGILTGAILALTAAELINGIVKFLAGGDNFSQLGTELSVFITNAKPFIDVAAQLPPAAMNGVKSLASAILTLTAANVLDGLARFFGGGSASLSEFGDALPDLGKKLSAFVSNLGEFSEAQITTTDCAGKAIVALAESAKALPKSGGLWQKMFGESSLAEFADAMPTVAKGVTQFVAELGEFSDPQIKTAQCACAVIKALADAADSIPKKDGLWQKVFGSKGLKDFAKDMPKVAEGVAGFIDELEGYEDSAKIADAGANIIKSLAKLSDVKFDKFPHDKCKEALTNIGKGIASFVKELKAVSEEDIKSSKNKMKVIVDAVTKLVDAIDESFDDNTGKIVKSADQLAKKASAGLASASVIEDVKKQGKNFVTGFANGISNNSGLAESAATQVAQRALNASKKKLDEHSPSKETQKQGEYFGEGFIIGIEQYTSRIYDVSANVGNEAKRGLSSAIAKISNLVQSDVSMNPTIRPVLDLSEVSEGASYINSMFGNPSMQMAANLNSISSSMNDRASSNSDIISAIDKLGRNLGNTNGNTYNINGITYDDSNNINRAVQDLVRAIEVERRV